MAHINTNSGWLGFGWNHTWSIDHDCGIRRILGFVQTRVVRHWKSILGWLPGCDCCHMVHILTIVHVHPARRTSGRDEQTIRQAQSNLEIHHGSSCWDDSSFGQLFHDSCLLAQGLYTKSWITFNWHHTDLALPLIDETLVHHSNHRDLPFICKHQTICFVNKSII